MMTQTAEWPTELAMLVRDCTYRPGWAVKLGHIDRGQGSEGLTLIITTLGYDSYHPENGQTYRVNHYFPVPPAAYDAQSWRRWLLERFLMVERHEACEFFTIAGVKPYAPHHGPGHDPYIVFEVGTEADQQMRYTGEMASTPARMPDWPVSHNDGV
jgi:hypothetical protein